MAGQDAPHEERDVREDASLAAGDAQGRERRRRASRRRQAVRIAIGLLVGAALGYGYYRLVGCASGACPLASNPWLATLYGAMLGAAVGAAA